MRSGRRVWLWEAGLMVVGQPSCLFSLSSNRGSNSTLHSVLVALSVPFRDIPVSVSSLSLDTVLRVLMQWDPRGNLAQSLCVTYEEIEAQRGEMTCPPSHRWEVAELGLEFSSHPPPAALPAPPLGRLPAATWLYSPNPPCSHPPLLTSHGGVSPSRAPLWDFSCRPVCLES